MASIYLPASSKYYWASFSIFDPTKGKKVRKRVSTHEVDKGAALRVAEALESASKVAEKVSGQRITLKQLTSIVETIFITAGVDVELDKPCPPILDYFEAWLDRIKAKRSKATHANYKGYFENFKTWLITQNTNATLDWLTTARAKEYYAFALIGASISTANFRIKTLSTLYHEAMIDLDYPENPIAKVRLESVKKGESLDRLPFSMDEVMQVIDHLESCEEVEWSLAVKIGLLTGSRLSDAVAMRREWLKDGVLSYTQDKTGKALEIPIVNEEWRKQLEATSELITPTLSKLSSSRLSRQFTSILEAAGIEQEYQVFPGGRKVMRKSYHSLRHTLRTQIIATSGTGAQADMILGHSPGMGKRYTHSDLESMRVTLGNVFTTKSQKDE